ncbi:hypothetical protein ABQE48_08195 [Mycolicibacterium thermoresistibile]
MLEQFVADGGDTLRIGSAIGAFLFPILGALLLVIGVRRRIAHNRWHQRDDERLLAASPNVPDLTPLPASRGLGSSWPAWCSCCWGHCTSSAGSAIG